MDINAFICHFVRYISIFKIVKIFGYLKTTKTHSVFKIMKNPLCEELLFYQPASSEVEDLYSSYIANCVLNAFLTITAIILNSVTIQALRRTSSLPKPLKALLLSLAASDLGVGLLCHPLCITLMVKWSQQNTASNSTCALYTAFIFSMGLFSVPTFFGVTALSIDRFLAIHLHLRYQELVTHKRVVAVVISIWVFSAFFSLMRLWIPTNIFFAIFICISIVCPVNHNITLLQDLFCCTTAQRRN